MTFTISTFLTRVLPSGVCWICYDEHVDRLFVIIQFFWTNLTVEAHLSSVLTLRLHLVFLFSMSVCKNCFKFSNFEKLILKYLKNFCLSSFKCPNRVWNSPSSSLARNTLWIQYFCFFFFRFSFLQEGKAPKQWSHSPHNDPYLRL